MVELAPQLRSAHPPPRPCGTVARACPQLRGLPLPLLSLCLCRSCFLFGAPVIPAAPALSSCSQGPQHSSGAGTHPRLFTQQSHSLACARVRVKSERPKPPQAVYRPLLRAHGKGRKLSLYWGPSVYQALYTLSFSRTPGSDTCHHSAHGREQRCGEGSGTAGLGWSQTEPEWPRLSSPCSAPLHRGRHHGGHHPMVGIVAGTIL